MFKNFFKRRKMRTIAFGEPKVEWDDGEIHLYSIVFFENDNGKRKYIVKGRNLSSFHVTDPYIACETWKHSGLLPEWAKDPMAEKLMR